MKKIIQYMAAGLLLMMTGTGCEDNENWKVIPYEPEPPQTINITGTATIFTEAGETSLLKEVALDKGDGFDDKADVIGIITWLKAAGEFTITDSGVAFGKGDVVATDPLETVKLKEGGPAFKVAEDGLYYVLLNSADQQLTIVPAKIGVIGDATPNGWNGETLLTMAFDPATAVVTAKWSGELTNKMLKYRFSGDWGVSLPYGNLKARVHTNFGGVADGVVLGDEMIELNAGGKDLKIAKNGAYDVEWTMDLNTRVVKGKAKLTEEDTSTAELPAVMYVIGDPWGWSWEQAPQMTPVVGNDGVFWGVYYLNKDEGIKFNDKSGWGGDFGVENTDPKGYGDYAIGGSNLTIATAGFYHVIVTCTLSEDKKSVVKKITLAEPKIYVIGDCAAGGWGTQLADADIFTFTDAGCISPVLNAGVLRMCITFGASWWDKANWWQAEFTLKDGKISCRGNGGDDGPMKLVNVTAGQKVTLDFKTGAGKLE